MTIVTIPVFESGNNQNSMTLRDWFAGIALNSMPRIQGYSVNTRAREAYVLADAMLEARKITENSQ